MCPQGAARIRLRRCKGGVLCGLASQLCGFFSVSSAVSVAESGVFTQSRKERKGTKGEKEESEKG